VAAALKGCSDHNSNLKIQIQKKSSNQLVASNDGNDNKEQ